MFVVVIFIGVFKIKPHELVGFPFEPTLVHVQGFTDYMDVIRVHDINLDRAMGNQLRALRSD